MRINGLGVAGAVYVVVDDHIARQQQANALARAERAVQPGGLRTPRWTPGLIVDAHDRETGNWGGASALVIEATVMASRPGLASL